MFVRIKNSHGYKYLQIVESKREGKKVKQRVLATLGQVDALTESGKIDDLTRSLAKFSSVRELVDAQRQGTIQAHRTVSIGPALVFERLWHQLGIDEVIRRQLSERRCRFSLERAIFLTVLHRLIDPGSDRAAERWKEDFQIKGRRASSFITSTARWAGWASRVSSSAMMREARAAERTSSKRSFSAETAICSASWSLCSSTPPVCTSRVKGVRALGSTGTAKTTGLT